LQTAADLFVGLVAKVQPEQWDSPGLGEWTVRDLVGHTSLALLSLEERLGHRAHEVEVTGPAAYYRKALAQMTPEENAEAGRAAGKRLGLNPAADVAALAARVLPRVNNVTDSRVIHTSVGGMRLVDYLPTRVFELTVHSLDLAGALGVVVDPPLPAMVTSMHVLGNLASIHPDRGMRLLLAGTGRTHFPPELSVL
jgi:uncharacterized protein (TIGR03083 family)